MFWRPSLRRGRPEEMHSELELAFFDRKCLAVWHPGKHCSYDLSTLAFEGIAGVKGHLRRESLQVMIPEVACRHLIGARGDRIKLLREESRCEQALDRCQVAEVTAALQHSVACFERPSCCLGNPLVSWQCGWNRSAAAGEVQWAPCLNIGWW